MRIAATSDIHGFLPEIPDCDILLLAGDLGPMSENPYKVIDWWKNSFGRWLVGLVSRGIVPIGIAGNHDFILQDRPELIERMRLPWVYLKDSGTEVLGLKIWGTPWQPWFCDWAFNAPEFAGEEFLREKFQQIPDDTDVIVAHTPPAGFHDRVGNKNVGSIALNERIQQVMPKLAVYGHVHHGYGVEQVEGVTLANVSATKVVGNHYELANPPVLFEL